MDGEKLAKLGLRSGNARSGTKTTRLSTALKGLTHQQRAQVDKLIGAAIVHDSFIHPLQGWFLRRRFKKPFGRSGQGEEYARGRAQEGRTGDRPNRGDEEATRSAQ